MSGVISVKKLGTNIFFAFALAGLVSGCVENGAATTGEEGVTDAAQRTELVERDVEAPDVFQVEDRGLWDGRPSLGGVWVAHPEVGDPERVIIRNTENGKFVIGALFRRERENPGPELQVSSDAAEALGMLAGAPAQLSVIALRREEAPVETPPTATTDFDTPTDIQTTTLDPIAGAAAAIDAAEGTDAAAPTPNPAPAAAPVAAAPAPTAAPAPAPAPAASNLSKPFIQIGIFSVEANANRAADMMRSSGLTASVRAQESQGKSFWRVLVGPAGSESERADLLSKVKAQGFADAYFVAN